MSKLRVLLVRHGESEANIDWDVSKRKADHAIELTSRGREQAKACGEFLATYIHNHITVQPAGTAGKLPVIERVRLWNSPYQRTRQTASLILENCVAPDDVLLDGETESVRRSLGLGVRKKGESLFVDSRSNEHVALHEQLFGIFDGLSDEERVERFPVEWAYYKKCKDFEGKVWARHPGGESRIDVAVRVHNAFGTFVRDHERHNINTVVIVAHGTVNRAFAMRWCHHTWEFLEKEPNPKNCSVRLLENGEDKGYIFAGFDPED